MSVRVGVHEGEGEWSKGVTERVMVSVSMMVSVIVRMNEGECAGECEHEGANLG